MNILTINTAFEQTYVAVQNNNKVETKFIDSSLKQSENVLGIVDDCLTKLKLTIKDLDYIGCVVGPGSFTGIRIGASLVKGFCMACTKIKKIEINSLDLLAFTYANTGKPNNNYYVVLNGLSGNIFVCKYNKNAQRLTEPEMIFGDGLLKINGIIVGLKQEELDICNAFVNFSSEELLRYTNFKINKNEYSLDFVPLYLRKSQAEAELERKSKNNKT